MNVVVSVLVLWVCTVAVAQADRTAYVASKAELVAALDDHSVTTIVLTGSFSTAHNHSALHDPVIVRRNLTLQPLLGKDVLLDLDFADGLLKLCSTCTLKIYNLTVANDRRGAGPGYDAIVGDPGSRVISQHVERLRLACTPPTLPFKNINGTRRSASFQHADKPQLLGIQNYTFGGKAYPQSLVYRDVSIDIPYSMNEGRSFVGGYSLHALSDVLLCQHFVSDVCLDRKPGDSCVDDLVDELTEAAHAPQHVVKGDHHHEQRQQQLPPAATSSLSPAARAAAISVPVIVAGLLLAGAAFVVWRQRKQLKVLRAGYQAAAPAASSGGHKGKDADAPCAETAASYTASPKAPHYSWQLHSSLISPLVGGVQDTAIEFGDLLGSGSFGRVFKGRWAGRTVAIKVIEHSSDAIAAVENEIRLMFSFNHQNLVRALYCVTYQDPDFCRNTASPGSCSASASSSKICQDRHDCLDSAAYNTVSANSSTQQHQPAMAKAGPPEDYVDQQQQQPNQPPQQQQHQQDDDLSTTLEASAPKLIHDSSDQMERSDAVRVDCAALSEATGRCSTAGTGLGGRGTAGGGSTGYRRAETRLVLEYCDCGTLRTFASTFWKPQQQQQQLCQDQTEAINQSGSSSSDPHLLQLLMLLHGAAQGLEVLHSSGVVHGDLTANNVLVSASGAAAGSAAVAKVADLGLARVMDHNRTHLTTSTLGTMNHMPPEQLQGGQLSPAGDIYAFGIMLYELYTGTTAFRKLQHVGQFYETVVLHKLRPLVPQHMPADLRLLMEHCWATDPASRPSADRVVECLRAMVQDRQQKLVVGATAQASDLQTAAAGGSAGRDLVSIGPLDMQQLQQLQQRPSRFRAAASGFKQSVLRQASGSSFFERNSSAAGSIASSKKCSSLWRFGSRNSSMFAGSTGTFSGFGAPAGGLGYGTFDYPFRSPSSADDTAFDPHTAQMVAEDQAVLSRTAPQEQGHPPSATAADVRSWSQKPWLLSKERDVSERSWRLGSLRSSSGHNSTTKGPTGMWFV